MTDYEYDDGMVLRFYENGTYAWIDPGTKERLPTGVKGENA